MEKQISEYWENNWKNVYTEDGRYPSCFAQKIYKFLEFEDVKNILDVGAGKGRDSLFFASRGYNVTALDISKSALDYIKSKNPKIDTICTDIADYDFPSKKFDMIFANLSLHYWETKKLREIIKCIKKSLKSEALFCISCKSIHDVSYGKGQKIATDIYVNEHLIHFFDVYSMQKLLKDFRIMSICETTVHEPHYGSSTMIEAIVRKF